MRKGFTLVELLVVIGIMAMLSTASVAGYYSAVRGMTDKGVRQDVVSILRLARQRAQVDGMPVVCYFNNKTMTTRSTSLEGKATYHGVVTVVRMAGRISCITSGGLLVDEFADWKNTYGSVENASDITGSKEQNIRLYRLKGAGVSMSQTRSSVSAVTIRGQYNFESLPMSGMRTNESDLNAVADDASFFLSPDGFSQPPKSDYDFGGFPAPYGFKKASGDSVPWAVGDAYGVEVAQLELPEGYIFSSSVNDNRVGLEDLNIRCEFFPVDINANLSKTSSDDDRMNNIQIYARRPNGINKVGSAISRSELDDK